MKDVDEKNVVIHEPNYPTVRTEPLNWYEKWQIAKDKSEAKGRTWMVIVDAMIEDEILKKRIR